MRELVVAFVVAVLLTGCQRTQNICHLLSVAYNEQDELNAAWYKNAATALRECGYIVHDEDVSARGKL